MASALRQELEKMIEEDKGVTFSRAPKALIKKTVKKVIKQHQKTIKELADR